MLVFMGWIVSIIVTSILRGFVFQKLWFWFIVPIFGISPIGIAESLGLMFVVGLVTQNDSTEENDQSITEVLVKSTLKSIFISVVYLVFGFIVKGFV